MANVSIQEVSFCVSPLWDQSLLINSTYPQFTECFRNTVLVYVPCTWLWVTGALHLRYVFRNQSRVPVSESVLNITKTVLCLLLAVLSVVQGIAQDNSRDGQGMTSPVAGYMAVGLQASTYLFAAVLTKISRKALIVSPCVLFIFWTLALVANVIPFYTTIMNTTLSRSDLLFILPCCTFAVLSLQLILNCFGEASLRYYWYLDSDKPPSPEVYASFPSKITFHWMNSLIFKGFRNSLTLTEDIWDLPPQCKGQAVISRFYQTVDRYTKKTSYRRISRPSKVSARSKPTYTRDSYNTQSATESTPLIYNRIPSSEAIPTTTTASAPQTALSSRSHTGGGDADAFSDRSKSRSRKTIPLLSCLVRTFCFELLACNLIRLVGDCLQFANPALLNALIGYIENRASYRPWYGYILVCGFFVVSFIVSICQNQNVYHSNNVGMKIKTVLVATVYRKALNMSNAARRQFTTGAIVNFMAVDCQKMQTVSSQLWVLLSAPVQDGVLAHWKTIRATSHQSGLSQKSDSRSISQSPRTLPMRWRGPEISLAFYFLSAKLGVSFLVGVAIIIVLIPINIRVSLAARQYQARQLLLKDQRLRMLNELLTGIKVIKLSAWEESFIRRVTEIRDAEVQCLKKVAIFTTISVFNWICSPLLVTIGTLVTYAMVSEEGSLDPATAFVSLSLFNILKAPVNSLPNCISELVQSHVSLTRLRNFLSCEELRPSDVYRNAEDGVAISVRNATLTWDPSLPPALSRINLEVKDGQLVAVVGPVGAGKSSLLSAFLGEMHKIKGNIYMRGSVAYVPQQAWIQNRSLRDCVLFDNKLDAKRYKKIVRACALKPDIEILPAGDATEIGEKGVNLSGGQKLRVTLARAVYQDADVYLLDDPLSAVDSRVGKHIFRKVISASGLLKTKTRVMVTHGIHWLPMCDLIVVMDQGHIIQSGTYEQLLKHDGPFAQYLKTHLRQETEHLDPEIQKILGQMHVRVENITSDGMTSADEDDFRLKKKSSRPRERAAVFSGEPESGDKVHGRQLVQEELTQTGKIKTFVLWDLLNAFGKGAAMLCLALLVLYNALDIVANIWLSRWTSDPFLRNSSATPSSSSPSSPSPSHSGTGANGSSAAEDEGESRTEKTALYVAVYTGLGLLQAVFTFFFLGIIYINIISASKQLHNNMLVNILHQPMRFFDTNPLGRILNRFSRDVDAVDGSMARLLRMFATQVFRVLSVVTVVTYSTPFFFFSALPMMVLYYLVQRFYIPCSRQLRRNESVSRSPIYSHFSETVLGAASIRAFGVTQRFQTESERLVDKNNVYFYAFISASRWLRIRLGLMGNLVIVFAALFAVLSDDLNGSLAGLSVAYALQVTSALNILVQNSTQLESNIVSVERLVEYINLPQEPAWVVVNQRPDRQWPNKGVVRFNKYSTRYRPGLDLVLHGISCTVHSGEKVGIVGRTGAGKSSLSLSLFRLLEAAEGSITIDGVTIANIGLHDLRSRITILPQDPVLFSGSLRFNLDPLEQYSDSQVWSALEQAYLKGFVAHQPEGLMFEVDEGGLNLSVGQRQLVCLARALLRRTRVLILDEATAAVDLERDELIQNTLRTAFNDCTVLTIAHRLNTVLDYDKIIVLENGRITEMDSPDNLLADRATVFYRMAQEAQLVP